MTLFRSATPTIWKNCLRRRLSLTRSKFTLIRDTASAATHWKIPISAQFRSCLLTCARQYPKPEASLTSRLQHQLMRTRLFHRRSRKRQGKSEALVARAPLVHEIRAEQIPRLAGHQVQGGLIEISEINRHSLRRSVAPRYCFHGVFAA